MSDADLIYSALLRTERRLEERYRAELRDLGWMNPAAMIRHCICRETFNAIRTLREEVGNGMGKSSGWISHAPQRSRSFTDAELAWLAEAPKREWWPWAVVAITIIGAVLGVIFFRWSNT